MSNAFLEEVDKWKAKHPKESAFGFPTLRLQVGTVQFRVIDEKPTIKFIHYGSVGSRRIICPEDGCLFCGRGDSRSEQHFLNVVDRADDQVKVLMYSAAASEEITELIKAVAEENAKNKVPASENHPRNYDIRVTREGTGKTDTRYTAAQVQGVEFVAEKYTPIDLSDKLKSMPIEEMGKLQGMKEEAPASGRKVREFDGQPPEQAPPQPQIKTVIKEDDLEVL